MTKLQLIPLSLLLLMITLAISAAGDSLGGDTITIPGDSRSIIFNPGDYMGDLNGQHLILEPNCNLVLYNGTTPLWASSSARPTNPSKCQAAFQMDGHLVVYADDTAIWASGTYTSGLVEGRLQLQGGHFQIAHVYVDDYEITFDVSNPAPHGGAHWRPVSDTGSVVVNADDDDDLLWQENEFLGDLTGTYLILQDDCNLLLYNQEGAIWASNSYKPVLLACEVALRRDGNLEVHAKDRPEVVFWSSASITNNAEVASTELRVSDDMFELIQTLNDESEVTYDNGDL